MGKHDIGTHALGIIRRGVTRQPKFALFEIRVRRRWEIDKGGRQTKTD